MEFALHRDTDEETSAQVLAPLRNVCISLFIINTVFFALRFTSVLFVRQKKLRLTWDDWLLVPAYVLLMGMISIGLVTHHYTSLWPGSPDELIMDPHIFVPNMKTIFALTQLVTPAFAFTRFSILSLFIRIFYRPYVRITSYCLIGFVICEVIAFNVAAATQCMPISLFWNKVYYETGGGGQCVNLNEFYRSFQSPEMFVDLIIIVLPLPEVWRLRSSNTRKLGLTAIFLTGTIAFIANCYRQYIFVKHNVEIVSPRVNNATVSWTILEPSLCFIAACLPALHPLVSLFIPSRWKRQVNRQQIHVLKRVSPEPRRTLDEEARQLVSSRAETPISPPEPPRTYGYEVKVLRTPSMDELEASVFPSVPLNDWRQVSHGDGVLVRTEISVTQEDIIEDVLGL